MYLYYSSKINSYSPNKSFLNLFFSLLTVLYQIPSKYMLITEVSVRILNSKCSHRAHTKRKIPPNTNKRKHKTNEIKPNAAPPSLEKQKKIKKC